MVEIIDIHNDERGYIKAVKNLLKDNREFSFLEVKEGFARGGCFHTEDEWFVVIEGKIKVILGDKESIFSKGESGKLPKLTPHAFFGLQDSIVSEWGIKTEEKEKDKKDKALRELVDNANKLKRSN